MGNVVWRTGKGGSRSRFDGVVMCGLPVKRAVRMLVVVVESRRNPKHEMLNETHRSPVFLPNASPRYRFDAKLSSPELGQVPVVQLFRRDGRSD